MTSNTSSSNASSKTSSRYSLRPKLRQATLILPTGKRVKRNVTFGAFPGLESADDGPSGESSPLLRKRSAQQQGKNDLYSRVSKAVKNKSKEAWRFANSKTGRGVFKCSIAYLLGSMATFVPGISGLLGQQDGKHMVATITVYFHPARSIGSMFEAVICAALAFIYAVFICFSSMGLSIFFGKTLDLIVLGHTLVLIIFCGGGLGFIGWTKQRLGHPLVNISCSLTSLAIITVLTKEGAVQAAEFSDDKVTQVMIMIIMGVVATTAVSVCISPVSARTELRSDLVQVTDSLGDLLAMITRGFLTGSEEELQQQAFLNASDKNKKAFTSLAKNLKESKYEYYVLGTEKEYHLAAKLVNCTQRLAQNIGGLKSAAITQFLLMSQHTFIKTPTTGNSSPLHRRITSFESADSGPLSPSDSYGVLEVIDEIPEEELYLETNAVPTGERFLESDDIFPPVKSPSDIFSRFIVQLGPSMKSLAVTLRKILDELAYDPAGHIIVTSRFVSSLEEAIKLYTRSRQEALDQLYKHKELTKSRPFDMEADFEEVAASCGYFSFSLLDFANEMKVYLYILDELKLEVEERPEGRTWAWLKIWRKTSRSRDVNGDPERAGVIDQNNETELPRDIPSPTQRKAFIELGSNANPSIQTYRYRLWCALSFFRRDDIKFAIKVGVGAALYSEPSFMASTRPFYQHWRGEWGLLSYMLVCSMTVGASNTTGYARFLGTCIGAVCAIVAWNVSGGNVYLLAFFGWVMSLWTAYIIVAQGKGPMGRFIMLTYNLSALYAYSLSAREVDGDEDEGGHRPVITDITLHRVVAVLSGCLWGLIVTRLIWPISARQKFKEGLSILWLRMGLIWKRDPLNRLLEGVSTSHPYMDLGEEFDLHRYLARLENLLSSAASEVDLRGPFPSANYSKILKSTGAMLDAFHAMNVMIMKNPRASKGEAEILRYTASERAQLCARISHLFQVLASSMKLEFPLNEALPSIDHTRDRLLAKVFQFRKEENDASVVIDEDFELLYAYALVTGQLSNEIKHMGNEIEKLFGVLNEELLKLE